jgi:hypothetical protein
MGYVDDQAVCDGCYNDCETENWEEIRGNIRAQQEEERAKDPEAYDARQLAIKQLLANAREAARPDVCPTCHLVRPCECEPTAAEEYSAMVRKQAELHPGREWVPAPPGKTPGFIHATPHLEPPTEQEDPMSVEPGIQALMAAGLLEGQEPGGSGVCNAEIIAPDGKVTEVAIPVPVDPAPAKAPRKRASRAKAKPEPVAPAEEVPPTGSVGDAAAAALARVRSNTPVQNMVEGLVNPETQAVIDGRLAADDDHQQRFSRLEANAAPQGDVALVGVGGNAVAVRLDPDVPGGLGQAPANAARLAQLEANAAAVDIPAIMEPPAPAPDPNALQAGLQAAVDAGTMDVITATTLGWVDPLGAMAVRDEARSLEDSPIYSPQVAIQAPAPVAVPPVIEAVGPRAAEALEDFREHFDNPAADIFIDALAAAKSLPEEDAILAALDNLAPYEGMPGGVEEAKKSILAVIEDAITNHPRSLQVTIGPSEIGTECDHCLAAKLAGWREVRDGSPWLPTVGTAVHTWLEEKAFMRQALDASGRPRYLMERKVAVGAIGGVEITGSTDLVDLVRGMTWDWKVVGKTTLESAKVAPSIRYVVQQMLYARGWRRLGVNITHVGIAYLPRNEVSLRKAVLWTAEYDEALAEAALARADNMDRNLKAMATLGVEARDKYISSLDRWRSWRERDPVSGVEKLVKGNAQDGRIECLDCPRYPDYPEDPAKAMSQLDGLL